MNRDTDHDGKCDLNCDTNNDGFPDENIDLNGDNICDMKCKVEVESNENSGTKPVESKKPNKEPQTEENGVVKVTFKETNIINLTNQISVSDDIGLQNPAQTFTVSNDRNQLGSIDYTVNYTVSLVDLTSGNKKIDKRYIKYRYTRTSSDGSVFTSDIGTLSDLTVQSNGNLLLDKRNQPKGQSDSYSVVFWVSSSAGNDQQGKEFLMAFKIDAGVTINN